MSRFCNKTCLDKLNFLSQKLFGNLLNMNVNENSYSIRNALYLVLIIC